VKLETKHLNGSGERAGVMIHLLVEDPRYGGNPGVGQTREGDGGCMIPVRWRRKRRSNCLEAFDEIAKRQPPTADT